MGEFGGEWYCPDCDEYFDIICNNVPWIDIKYCPNCGKEVLEWKDDDEK